MGGTTQAGRLVYVLPRVNVSSMLYGEKSVSVGDAHFWPDQPNTWSDVLGLPRPEWLDVFREFPGIKRKESSPARGTLLIAKDDMWLQQNVSRIIAVLYVAGVEGNCWEVPSDAFQYHGFKATPNPADLVVLHTKTSGKTEDLGSLQLLPPLELRAVSGRFRINTNDDLVRELFRRFDSNPNDRLAAACYHLFRTQFENTFLSPAEQDYAAFCACLEAALDIKGTEPGQQMADRLLSLFPSYPDIVRWIKGLYSERSVFNHGATVEEADALKDDRAKALFEFRSRRQNWDVLRHLCLDVVWDQLRESSGSNHELARMWSHSARLMSHLFDSQRLWQWVVKEFTQKNAVMTLLALNGEEFDDFVSGGCAYLNGFHWKVVREKVEAKKVFQCLMSMAALIGETAADEADKQSATRLFNAAKAQDSEAVDLWARHHAMWESGAAWESINLLAKAVAVKTAHYCVK